MNGKKLYTKERLEMRCKKKRNFGKPMKVYIDKVHFNADSRHWPSS
jgi:hypothetical protein